MNKIKLVLPDLDYKDQVRSYIEEFIENDESFYGTGGLNGEKRFEG